mmetsp:Transcript_29388/g.32665  ORF Transcript_29388/g.32665 Transcript_29388/m.32665 type:complete len:1191 (+) Transcript_29388:13-3585(+)
MSHNAFGVLNTLSLYCFLCVVLFHFSDANTQAELPERAGGWSLVVEEEQFHSETALFSAPNIDQITVALWLKNTIPSKFGTVFQYVNKDAHTSTDAFAIYWYFDLSVDILDQRVSLSTDSHTISDGHWHHFAVTWESTTGAMKMYQDGQILQTSTVAVGKQIPMRGQIFLGKERYGEKFYGQLDEVVMFTKALTESEIATLANQKIALTDPNYSSVFVYYDFDDSVNPSISSDASDKGPQNIPGRLVNSNGGNRRTVSLINIESSPLHVIKVASAGSQEVINLRPTTSLSVLSLPSHGDIFTNTMVPLANGNTIPSPFTFVYVPRVSLTSQVSDSFTMNVDGENTTVLVYLNRAPTALNFVFEGREDEDSDIVLGRRLYPDLKATGFTSVDADSDDVMAYITRSPVNGVLKLAGDVVQGPLPVGGFFINDTSITITYKGNSHLFGEQIDSFSYLLEDINGARSQEENVTITLLSVPDIPAVDASQVSTDEDTEVVVTISWMSLDNETLDDVLRITQLPTQGRLFQYNATSQTRGEEIILGSTVELAKGAWANSSASSSFWDGASGNWHVEQLEGPADTFPAYGDIPTSWAPSGPNRAEWVEVTFTESVFPQQIEIYETYYPGNVVDVLVFNEEVNRWLSISNPETNENLFISGQSRVFSPNICPIPFKTRKVRIETQPGGEGAFVEFDAVRLWGTSQIDSSIVTDPQGRVVYVPNQDANGLDTFKYLVNDCKYYLRFRDLGLLDSHVNVTINPINDVPVIIPTPIDTTLEETTNIVLDIGDVDNDALSVTITKLPEGGTLQQLGKALTNVPVQVNASTLSYVSDKSQCVTLQEKAQVYFKYRVSDGILSSDEAQVNITIKCINFVSTREVSDSVSYSLIVCSIICVIAVCVALFLVFYWRDTATMIRVSPLFCALNLVGALLLCISPILLASELNTCMPWSWFALLGITMFVSPIIVKTYRVDKIFHAKKMIAKVITNKDLAPMATILTVIQLLLLIVWTAGWRLEKKLFDVPNVPFENVKICSGRFDVVFWGIEAVYVAAILVAGCVLALRTRNINLGSYKETKEILFAIYNFSFVIIILTPIAIFLRHDPNTFTIIIGFGTLFATIVSVLALYVMKFYRIAVGAEKLTNRSSTLTNGTGGDTTRVSGAVSEAKNHNNHKSHRKLKKSKAKKADTVVEISMDEEQSIDA